MPTVIQEKRQGRCFDESTVVPPFCNIVKKSIGWLNVPETESGVRLRLEALNVLNLVKSMPVLKPGVRESSVSVSVSLVLWSFKRKPQKKS